jgi:carbonic anhydrase
VVVVLGHSSCGAIKGAVQNVDLGHLHFITSKIQAQCVLLMMSSGNFDGVDFDSLGVQLMESIDSSK